MTFACYGMHLHGEKSGSVDRNRKVPDKDRRTAVSEAIREVCIQRNRSPRAATCATITFMWPSRGSTTRSARDGRAMGARADYGKFYGKMNTSGNLSDMFFQDRVNQWKFTWQVCCSPPLRHSRGSAEFYVVRHRPEFRTAVR